MVNMPQIIHVLLSYITNECLVSFLYVYPYFLWFKS